MFKPVYSKRKQADNRRPFPQKLTSRNSKQTLKVIRQKSYFKAIKTSWDFIVSLIMVILSGCVPKNSNDSRCIIRMKIL